MNLWYRLVDLLPFTWANPDSMLFMKNALLAVILLAPAFGLLGTLVVNKHMAFFSDALGHGAFTGIAVGSLMGFIRPVWSAVIFAGLSALVVTLVKHKSSMATDTVIGIFSSTAIAFGVFLSTTGGRAFTKLNTYLVGDILSIRPSEILQLMVVLLAVLLLWILAFNQLLVTSVNSSMAASRGINVFATELLFSCSIAVIVTLTMGWIGLLVINSYLVLPAAAARNIARNIRQYTLAAVSFSVFSGIAGLLLSYYIGSATGATIVLLSTGCFLVTLAIRRLTHFG